MDVGNLLGHVVFPKLVKARQKFPVSGSIDIEEEVAWELSRPDIASKLSRGQSVAVAVGSRGIAEIDRIARAVVRQLKEMGTEPFVIPAMGSHGGATDEGQASVLAHLGITEETVGAPVRSSMEVVNLGTSPSGVPVCVDKLAHTADATVVINRVKLHTGFRGPVESGLMKMLAIGLGKQIGADVTHALGFHKFGALIPEMGGCILEKSNVVFGVAVLENAKEQPAKIVAVEASRFEEVEPGLLEEAKTMMARILFPKLDVLIVQEIGKNISGDGMDPNVTGRFLSYLGTAEPHVQKIVVLDLTPETYGNALGIGMADATTRRVVDKIDYYPMYVNAMTSRMLSGARVPLTLDTDKDAIATALSACFDVEQGEQKVMVIQNTLKLEEVYISESMLEEARAMDTVEVLGGPSGMSFDGSGTLQLEFEG